jgi:hypothetical protein
MHGNRKPLLHDDGSWVYQTPEIRAAQRKVADDLGRRWCCQICDFPLLTPVDWYGERHGRIVSVLELKSRNFESTRYPTTFLAMRKWMLLSEYACGLAVPALFVVKFTDGLRYILIKQVDARHHRIVETAEYGREVVIDVPVDRLRVPRDVDAGVGGGGRDG